MATGCGVAGCPANGHERLWAFEFRYDGPRQRYLVRKLDPVSLYRIPGADRWTAYGGDTPIQDFVYDGSWNVVPTMDYIPGISEVDLTGPEPVAHYVHTDHLGSSWLRTDDPASGNPARVGRTLRTAFGEQVHADPAPFTRYGYAGAWGYQQHDMDTNGQGDGQPDNTLNAPAARGFPYLHVGARYYDPATGRFLQRDPIGLAGGMNVYEHVGSSPLREVDPEGLIPGKVGGHCPIFGGGVFIGQNPAGAEAAKRAKRKRKLQDEYDKRTAKGNRNRLFLSCTPKWVDDKDTVKKVRFWIDLTATPITWFSPAGAAIRWTGRAIWGGRMYQRYRELE